jgi:hypothetical protein
MSDVIEVLTRRAISRRRLIVGGAAGGAALAAGAMLPSFVREALAAGDDGANPQLVLQLRGMGIPGEARSDLPPMTEGGDPLDALCFPGVDVVDLRTGKTIGSATDCLSLVEFQGDGIVLVATTTFNLPGGSFSARGVTTVQPVLVHSEFPADPPSPVTHTTVAVPGDPSANSVLPGTGTGRFADFQASVRLSGAVNMSDFGLEPPEMTFDCIFVISPLGPGQGGHGAAPADAGAPLDAGSQGAGHGLAPDNPGAGHAAAGASNSAAAAGRGSSGR